MLEQRHTLNFIFYFGTHQSSRNRNVFKGENTCISWLNSTLRLVSPHTLFWGGLSNFAEWHLVLSSDVISGSQEHYKGKALSCIFFPSLYSFRFKLLLFFFFFLNKQTRSCFNCLSQNVSAHGKNLNSRSSKHCMMTVKLSFTVAYISSLSWSELMVLVVTGRWNWKVHSLLQLSSNFVWLLQIKKAASN